MAKHWVVLLGVAVLAVQAAPAERETGPQHEIGLTLGRIAPTSRGDGPARVDLGGGVALQANYGYKLLEGNAAALYAEVHFLSGPLREATSAVQTATRDVATLFVTPGARVKFAPRSAVSPYAVVGGGYALYEQSLARLDGAPNTAPRLIHRAAFSFGGGVDAPVWRFVAARFEVRDFYTGSPAYNLPALRGGQHNVVMSGGVALRFR